MAWLLKNGDIGMHVPKTGGTWLGDTLRRLGLLQTDTRLPHTPLMEFVYPIEQAAFKFAFVRHPLTWYESWWRWSMDITWRNQLQVPILPACAFEPNADFNAFVSKCVEIAPGMVSAMYELFVGPTDHPIEFIGRQEQAMEDLKQLLTLRGLSFDASILETSGKQRVSGYPAPMWDIDLKDRVAKAEQQAMVRFGYSA